MMDLSVYTISGKKEAVEAAYINNRKLIAIRWIYIGVLSVVAAIVSVITTHSFDDALKYGAILFVGFVVNTILLLTAKAWKANYVAQRSVTISQLALDLAMAGVVTFAEGGIDARTTVLFMLPILATGLLFSASMVRWAALCSGVVYVAVVIIQDAVMQSVIRWEVLAVPLVFYPVIFLLLAQIATYLIRLNSLETREKAYDSYLSLLAHQLKHPVSAASMIVDTIVHDPRPLDPTTKHYVEMLQGENENLVRMIDNLLASAVMRKPQLRDEEFDLVEVITRSATKAIHTSDRPDDFRLIGGDQGKILVRGDSIRLSLALLNVLDNAFRYSPEGTPVECEIRQEQNATYVVVRDKGSGINRHMLKQLYKKYTPSLANDQSNHLGGVGLGLHVTREIIEAHGGTIRVESSEDEGTSVIMSIKGVKHG